MVEVIPRLFAVKIYGASSTAFAPDVDGGRRLFLYEKDAKRWCKEIVKPLASKYTFEVVPVEVRIAEIAAP